ncbi:ROK family protein [Paenibacillus sp. MSJ-34]|uniref:ROK family protein n=1 Tax=Paenibacillus sp. MSJ-34 TaxID=2841529 RepID=UPI001C10E92D|nr:ROK family protein [Paenibacillus sp. MSJ-34]
MLRIEDRISNPKHKAIYRLIRNHPTVSKLELLEQTKMPVSTLTRLLEELIQQRFIVEAGFGDSTGGRKPVLYRIHSDYAYVFGLEISRTRSKLVLYDMDLQKLASEQWRMDEHSTPDYLLQSIAQSARYMLADRQIAKEDVLGLGIGSVGPLDRSTGTLLKPQHFPAPGWVNVPVADILSRSLDIPVFLDNGANTAILGEYWHVRDKRYKHLLYVHAGAGIRSAMIAGGSVVYGAVDTENAIGQMIIQSDGHRLTPDSNFGSLESYVSIPAIEREARSKLKQGRQSVVTMMEPDPEKISFIHLQQALTANDPLVTEIFKQASAYLGIGLANLLNILHPEKVILGGPILYSHPLVFETAVEVANRNTYHHSDYRAEFSRGNLGEEALVLGAAVMTIHKLAD